MGELQPRIRLWWNKKEKDLRGYCDPGTSKSAAHYLMSYALTKEVLDELDARGYDLSTLRFQIRRKPQPILDTLAEIE